MISLTLLLHLHHSLIVLDFILQIGCGYGLQVGLPRILKHILQLLLMKDKKVVLMYISQFSVKQKNALNLMGSLSCIWVKALSVIWRRIYKNSVNNGFDQQMYLMKALPIVNLMVSVTKEQLQHISTLFCIDIGFLMDYSLIFLVCLTYPSRRNAC